MNYHPDYTVVVLPASNRGRNKRGICAHKPSKPRTKRAKRQNVPGFIPILRMSPPPPPNNRKILS